VKDLWPVGAGLDGGCYAASFAARCLSMISRASGMSAIRRIASNPALVLLRSALRTSNMEKVAGKSRILSNK